MCMWDRNFESSVTGSEMWSCTWSNKRVKSCYCVRSRLSTDQDDLWRGQPVAKRRKLTRVASLGAAQLTGRRLTPRLRLAKEKIAKSSLHLVGTSIFLRLKDFGWSLGKLVDRVARAQPYTQDRRGAGQLHRRVRHRRGRTDGPRPRAARVRHLAERRDGAEYESWMLLEPNTTEPGQ